MSKRFQEGSVKCIGGVWKGRYWMDVPGEEKRKHPQIDLGTKREMTKAEARRKLADIIDKLGLNKSNYVEKLEGRAKTFNEVADAWESKRLPQLALSTQDSAPGELARHKRPFLGALPLETIKTKTVNEWITGLVKSGLHPKTVENKWKYFTQIMNWHARQNDEPKRTWYPDLPDIPDIEQRWFTLDEMRRIIHAAGQRKDERGPNKGQYRPLFQLTAFSGLRSGEVSGLHVEDLDLVRGVVHVQPSVYRGIEVPTKGKRRRFVDIDSTTVQMLQDYLGGRRTGRVFQTSNGTPLDNSNINYQVLKPICAELGVKPGTMHAFRHGRVSLMRQNSVPPELIQRQVGHSNLRTTSGYTHFSQQFVRDTVERLSQSGLPN